MSRIYTSNDELLDTLVMGRKNKLIYLRNLAKSGGSIDSLIKARRDSTSYLI